MGTRISFLGWYRPGIRHPPSFPTHPSMTATSSATFGDRDRRASTAATGRRIVPSITESRLGRAWGCFLGRVSSRWRTRLRSAINSGKFSEQEPRRPGISRSQVSSRDSRHVENGDFSREKQKPGSCRQRGDLNGVAEVLQTHDEASGVDGFGPLVEVVRAEIAIELTADQHVVDAGQDRGGERAERLFGAAAGAQAVELGLEIAGLLAGGGRGALHEGGLEPRGPLAHPSRSALAGALVVFRAQAGPGDQVPGGRK